MLSVSAPGKVHLTSAHIVVYGKPALLGAVGLRTRVVLKEKKLSGNVEIDFHNYSRTVIISSLKAFDIYAKAQKNWQEFFRTKNSSLLKKIHENPTDLAIYSLAQAMQFLKITCRDLSIEISSEIPIGANMGSSAALSAGVIGSLFLQKQKKIDKQTINDLVFETEKLMHGFPSGGDNTIVVMGGVLWFRKELETLKLFKSLNLKIPDNYLLINSGQPLESTGEMVLGVRKRYSKRPKYFSAIFNKMETYKKEYLLSLLKNDLFAQEQIIKSDERLFEKLGTVSYRTKKLIRDLERLHAAVGVSGGGGDKVDSGVLVAYCEDKNLVKKYLDSLGLFYYDVKIGVEGLREEKK